MKKCEKNSLLQQQGVFILASGFLLVVTETGQFYLTVFDLLLQLRPADLHGRGWRKLV